MTLEKVVRPYLAASIHPVAKQQAEQAKAVDEALLEFGGSGESVFKVTFQQTFSVEKIENVETTRTVDQIKITNPSDPSQFVQSEVVTKLESRNRISGERRIIKYANPEASATQQIIKRGVVKTNSNPYG